MSLRDLHRLCPGIRDTTWHGDESVDTAIVISRPRLTVIGRVANIASDGDPPPYKVDSSRSSLYWSISGKDALLPGGVQLSAPWDSLVRAYGKPLIHGVNGEVFGFFCKVPDFVFHVDNPTYGKELDDDSLPVLHSKSPVRDVSVSAVASSKEERNRACTGTFGAPDLGDR